MTRGQEAKNRLDEIKALLKTGSIDYATAKNIATEPLRILNEEMKKIDDEFGAKHRPIGFTKFMR